VIDVRNDAEIANEVSVQGLSRRERSGAKRSKLTDRFPPS
jgi:hypothetical protein